MEQKLHKKHENDQWRLLECQRKTKIEDFQPGVKVNPNYYDVHKLCTVKMRKWLSFKKIKTGDKISLLTKITFLICSSSVKQLRMIIEIISYTDITFF